MNEPLRPAMKVDQIRNPELPRSLRGFEVEATRSSVAAQARTETAGAVQSSAESD